VGTSAPVLNGPNIPGSVSASRRDISDWPGVEHPGYWVEEGPKPRRGFRIGHGHSLAIHAQPPPIDSALLLAQREALLLFHSERMVRDQGLYEGALVRAKPSSVVPLQSRPHQGMPLLRSALLNSTLLIREADKALSSIPTQATVPCSEPKVAVSIQESTENRIADKAVPRCKIDE